MNRYMQEKWSWIGGTHDIRIELLGDLSDADLRFTPGGTNMTLGALFRESGDVEHAYIQSLKTLSQNWSYSNTDPGIEQSVAQLTSWLQTLDSEINAIVAAFSDDDLHKTIDRGGFAVPVDMQLDIYLQALLIFIGKVTIYLRAMNRPLPQNVQEFIG
ncbi:MAG: DinB family protein [Ktedonobacterales bacterium]